MKSKYLKATIITNVIFYLLFLSMFVAPSYIIELTNLLYLIVLVVIIVLIIFGLIILVKSKLEDKKYIMKGLIINILPFIIIILSIVLVGLGHFR